METIYFDAPKTCLSFLMFGRQVVFTGLTVHREPVRYRNHEALMPLLQEDFHFYFEDEEPDVRLYAVPQLLILGYDSAGGHFATTRMETTLQEPFPLFYLSREGGVYQVEGDGSQLLTGTFRWQEHLRPVEDVKIYPSREMAQRDYIIHDLAELDLPGLPHQTEGD